MIKAGIFDIGGVLINWNSQWLFDDVQQTFQVTSSDVAIHLKPLLKEFEMGKLTEDEMWKQFVMLTHSTQPIPKESLLLREFSKRYQVNEDVMEVVKKIKRNGYHVALLSNTNVAHSSFIENQGLYEQFPVKVFSYLVGYDKPQPEIYQIVLKELKVNPEEAFFVDDLLVNAESATAVGIHGIHYQSVDSFKEELQKMGVKL